MSASIRPSRRTVILAAGALCAAGPAAAHHGWSRYRSDAPVTIDGVIQKSAYEFPHGEALIQDNATKKVWRCVLAPPSRMTARGLSADALKPGTPCLAFGYPHRDDPDEARIEYVVIAGKRTELR